jgi:DNA-binding transcriptional regulator YdaS (Cro superfamily)
MSKLRETVDQLGLANVARRLGITSQRLSNWLERGVPVEKCYALERALEGQVTRKDLRGDWREIWPELVEVGAPVQASLVGFATLPPAVRDRAIG